MTVYTESNTSLQITAYVRTRYPSQRRVSNIPATTNGLQGPPTVSSAPEFEKRYTKVRETRKLHISLLYIKKRNCLNIV